MHFWLIGLCNALSKQLPDRSELSGVGHADSKDGTPGEQSSDAANLRPTLMIRNQSPQSNFAGKGVIRSTATPAITSSGSMPHR
jgi:hypothetical protein